MEKAKRDAILNSLSPQDRDSYRQILQEIRAEAKALPGEQIARRKQVLALRLGSLNTNVQAALTATTARDESGPAEGEVPPDWGRKKR